MSLEEIFVALARLNIPVDDKDKQGILLCSLPHECGFSAIMVDTQNMDYESIWEILKADAERREETN